MKPRHHLIFVILLLLIWIPTVVIGAEVTRYVNTASSGGNGTTNAEAGTNAAYVSLTAWDAAEVTDLVTDTDTHIVLTTVGSGSAAETSQVAITSAWTTNATYFITVKAGPSDRHDGTWDAAKYRIEVSDATSGAMVPNRAYMVIDGLQVLNTHGSPTGGSSAIKLPSGTNITVKNSILRGGRYTLRLEGDAGGGDQGIVRNNLIYEGSTGGLAAIDTEGLIVDNNTFYGAVAYGILAYYNTAPASTEPVLTNNLARGATSAVYGSGGSGGYDAASDFNSASDATATALNATATSGTPWNSSSQNDSDYFTSAGGSDFTLIANSKAQNVGTDLSGRFTTDAVGTTRSSEGDGWDLGFYEIVEVGAGGASPGLIMIISGFDRETLGLYRRRDL